ncbi:hypothetical protein ACWC5I_37215 [Kitasatospora sp. NPDC001574]
MTAETPARADDTPAPSMPDEALVAVMAFVAVVGCSLLYLGSMTFTLVHYRHWPDLAGFLAALLLAAVALVCAITRLLTETFTVSELSMGVSWAAGAVLAGLQGAASLMGTGTVPMSMLIGLAAAVGITAFTELAADGL